MNTTSFGQLVREMATTPHIITLAEEDSFKMDIFNAHYHCLLAPAHRPDWYQTKAESMEIPMSFSPIKSKKEKKNTAKMSLNDHPKTRL